MSKAHRTTQAANATQTSYEGSVIFRASARAGRNPHLKGHIHEVLTQDSRNLRQALAGKHTALTRSPTAGTIDLVTMRGGKVIERLQLKDATSANSINKLVTQVKAGKYRSARLVGTDETTELVNAAFKKSGLSKRMVSSGTSSRTTVSLAQRAGAAGSGSLYGAAFNAARSGGAVGAWTSAGVEAVTGVRDLARGRRELGEVAGSVAKAGAKGYVTGAAASGAATITGGVVASGLASVGAGAVVTSVAAVAAPLTAAVAVGYGAAKLMDWLFD